jgi:hypothetical protein
LIRSQPVPDPGSQPPGTLHPSDARRQFRAQQAGIRRLIGQPPYRGEPYVDCGRGAIFCSRKNRYRSTTVRLNARRGSEQYHPMKLVNGVAVRFLRPRRRKRIHDSIVRLFEIREPKGRLWLAPLRRLLPTCHTGGLHCRALSMTPKAHIRSRNAISRDCGAFSSGKGCYRLESDRSGRNLSPNAT